jgi:hypothetical protein
MLLFKNYERLFSPFCQNTLSPCIAALATRLYALAGMMNSKDWKLKPWQSIIASEVISCDF